MNFGLAGILLFIVGSQTAFADRAASIGESLRLLRPESAKGFSGVGARPKYRAAPSSRRLEVASATHEPFRLRKLFRGDLNVAATSKSRNARADHRPQFEPVRIAPRLEKPSRSTSPSHGLVYAALSQPPPAQVSYRMKAPARPSPRVASIQRNPALPELPAKSSPLQHSDEALGLPPPVAAEPSRPQNSRSEDPISMPTPSKSGQMPMATTDSTSTLPFAKPIPGQTGFVRLDGRAELPDIDVRGLSPGTPVEVPDPASPGTTIQFRVP